MRPAASRRRSTWPSQSSISRWRRSVNRVWSCVSVQGSSTVSPMKYGQGEGESSSGTTRPEPAKTDLASGCRENGDQLTEQVAHGLVVRPLGEVRYSVTLDERPPERQLHPAGDGAAQPIEHRQRPGGKR